MDDSENNGKRMCMYVDYPIHNVHTVYVDTYDMYVIHQDSQ